MVSDMSRLRIFSREELAELRSLLAGGDLLRCPRCGVILESKPVPRPPGVAYVRRRQWYLCPSCGRSAVLDLPRPHPPVI